MVRIAILAFLSIFVLIGLAVFGVGLWQILDATGSSSWPAVPGTITRSEFLIEQETTETFTTRPDIAYTYRVAGKDLEGDRLTKSFSTSFPPGETRRWINDYTVGTKVDVFVDPDEPSDSVLQPSIPLEAWFFLGFGALFAVIPTIISLVVFSAITRARQSFDSTGDHVETARSFASAVKPLFGYLILGGFFSIFLIAGLVMLSFAVRNRSLETESQNWPSTDGVVIYSGIEHSVSTDDGRQRHTYTPRVVYDFEIDDVTYTAEGITMSDAGSSDRNKAASEIKPYPKKQAVEVFYSPDDPYQATLKVGHSSGSFILLILGIVFSLVGGLPLIGLTITKLWKSLSLGSGSGITDEGDSYDPFLKTEVEDPFDRPWDEQ